MDFLQAAGAPVVIKYGGQDLTIPTFDMDDVIALGNKIKDERVDAQTKGMNDEQRAQFMQYYPPLPPDMVELKRYVRTPEGMRVVTRVCLNKEGALLSQKEGAPRRLTGDEIVNFMKLPISKLGPLSWALADMEEKLLAPPPTDKGTGETDKGKS